MKLSSGTLKILLPFQTPGPFKSRRWLQKQQLHLAKKEDLASGFPILTWEPNRQCIKKPIPFSHQSNHYRKSGINFGKAIYFTYRWYWQQRQICQNIELQMLDLVQWQQVAPEVERNCEGWQESRTATDSECSHQDWCWTQVEEGGMVWLKAHEARMKSKRG